MKSEFDSEIQAAPPTDNLIDLNLGDTEILGFTGDPESLPVPADVSTALESVPEPVFDTIKPEPITDTNPSEPITDTIPSEPVEFYVKPEIIETEAANPIIEQQSLGKLVMGRRRRKTKIQIQAKITNSSNTGEETEKELNNLNNNNINVEEIAVKETLFCKTCEIEFSIDNTEEYLSHIKNHCKDKKTSVSLAILDPTTLPPFPPKSRKVARKRPTHSFYTSSLNATNFKLRLTNVRKAKAAEERYKAQEAMAAAAAAANTMSSLPIMETTMSAANTVSSLPIMETSVVNSEQDEFEKALAAISDSDTSDSNKVDTGHIQKISVVPTESLMATNSFQNTEPEEFVSLDMLASLTNISNITAPNSNSLENLAAMQPNPNRNLPNMLAPTNNILERGTADLISENCDVCGAKFPDANSLSTHKTRNGHFRCGICNTSVPSMVALNQHFGAVHAPNRGPPPLYHRQPVPIQNNFPPPLFYSQQPTRMQQQPQQQNFRPPNQFIAPPRQRNYLLPNGPTRNIAPVGSTPQQPRSRPNAAPIRPAQGGTTAPANRASPQAATRAAAPIKPPVKRAAPRSVPNGLSPVKVSRTIDIPARQPEDCEIIAVPKTNLCQISSVEGAAPDGVTIQPVKNKNTEKGAVASLLANRGITLTATPVKAPKPASIPKIPESLKLNTAISISTATPSSSPKTNGNGNFAVPKAPATKVNNTSAVERPPRPPTVDLTSEKDNFISMTNPNLINKYSKCHVCHEQVENNNASLAKHYQLKHPNVPFPPLKCVKCTSRFHTTSTLQTHYRAVHGGQSTPPPNQVNANDMGIPVINLKDASAIEKLKEQIAAFPLLML